ncbi:MAG: DUF692 family protein, partial [Turneriella sp.]|nr:DUF692 family protein [Turneriella sp.]
MRQAGLGLRSRHIPHFLASPPKAIGWLEIITENFFHTEGFALKALEKLRQDYPIAFHGVGLSIGSIDGPRKEYLTHLRSLAERIAPFQISDHFCFARYRNRQYHELLPLPRTQAMAERVIHNIQKVQDFLRRKLVLENISYYREYAHNEMDEPEFINYIAAKSGCGVLLDINNLYTNAYNFRYNARRAALAFDPKHVVQYHLAGSSDFGSHLLDTHGERVQAPVRRLFAEVRHHLGERPFSIERDENIPPLAALLRECQALTALPARPMPQRFHHMAVRYPQLKAKTAKLALEKNWQKDFYTAPPQKGERGAGMLSPQQALRLYVTAYQNRLSLALAEKFFYLRKFLGEKKFHALVKGYIATKPSRSENLSLYGDDLPQYLKRNYHHRPELCDLAFWDRAYHFLRHCELPESTDILKMPVCLGAAQ